MKKNLNLSDGSLSSDSESDGSTIYFFKEEQYLKETKNTYRKECYSFEVLSINEVEEEMKKIISEVQEITQIHVPTIRILLNHLSWMKDLLIDRLYNDQDKLFKDACVVNTCDMRPEITKIENESEDCEICYSNKPSEKFANLQCGHKFCEECCREYLTFKIMQEGLGSTISCPAYDCNKLIDDDTVMELAKAEDIKKQYLQLILNSFVKFNRCITWCPNAGCSYAIKIKCTSDEKVTVTCRCGHTFCFKCSEGDHDPIACDILKKWTNECSIFVAQHANLTTRQDYKGRLIVKQCPKCNTNIIKIDGCNYMVCRQVGCYYRFCWCCLTSWDVHNKTYRDKGIIIRAPNVEPDIPEYVHEPRPVTRFKHHYNYYLKHNDLFIYAEGQRGRVLRRLKKNRDTYTIKHQYLQLLDSLLEIVSKCLNILRNTYIFAYYFQNEDCSSLLFENNQRDLENATEDFWTLITSYGDVNTFKKHKQKIIQKAVLCEQLRSVLSKHVHEGYDELWWNLKEHLHL